MDSWLVTLIGIQMAFAASVIFIVFRHYNAKAQRRAELQARILDKFESPRELSEFLESADGKNLLHFLAPAPRDPRAALASGVKAALVLLFLGLGFGLVGIYINDDGLLVPSFICVGLGAGVGLAAIVGHRLTKHLTPKTGLSADSISEFSD